MIEEIIKQEESDQINDRDGYQLKKGQVNKKNKSFEIEIDKIQIECEQQNNANQQDFIPYNEKREKYQEKYNFMDDYIDASPKAKNKDLKANKKIQINNKTLIKYLQNSEEQYEQLEKQFLVKQEAHTILRQIQFFIQCGSNILVHGYGSKLLALNKVSEYFKDQVPIINIKGHLPSISMKKIFGELCYIISKNLNKQDREIKRIDMQLQYIVNNVDKISYDYILVLLHNIDAKTFRDCEAQNQLSKLAGCQKIRFVASAENIKYFLLLNQESFENFGFQHVKLNTQIPYNSEFKTQANLAHSKKNNSHKALKHILKSFTSNQKSVIAEMAKHLVQNTDTVGLTFRQLFDKCADEGILVMEQQLKENLLEILDHKVIIQKEYQNKQYYTMSYSPQILQQLAENKEIKDEEDEDEQEKGNSSDESESFQINLNQNDDDNEEEDDDDNEEDDEDDDEENSEMEGESEVDSDIEVYLN